MPLTGRKGGAWQVLRKTAFRGHYRHAASSCSGRGSMQWPAQLTGERFGADALEALALRAIAVLHFAVNKDTMACSDEGFQSTAAPGAPHRGRLGESLVLRLRPRRLRPW